jgi:hypothetical protein
VAVGDAQGNGFLRAERGVVQAAEEGGQFRPRWATACGSALTWSGLATTAGFGHPPGVRPVNAPPPARQSILKQV